MDSDIKQNAEEKNIRDNATILKPDLYSKGIEYVIVNGEFTVDKGELTGQLPGVIIRNNHEDY